MVDIIIVHTVEAEPMTERV